MIKTIDEKGVFLFKIAVLIIFLASTLKYTVPLYNYGIYLCVLVGGVLLVSCIINKKIKFSKIDYLLVAFSFFYCITMLLNSGEGFFKPGFVLICCLMYFFCFFSIDLITIEEARKQNNIMLFLILIHTLVCTLLSFGAVFVDAKNASFASFNLHGGNAFQLIGVYSGISTCAIMTGMSAIISFYFLFTKNNIIFKILNILNFIIQDLALTLTYTSAGIVTFGGTLVLGLIYVMFKKTGCRSVIASIIIIALSFSFVACNYYVMDRISKIFVERVSIEVNSEVNSVVEDTGDTIKIESDEALSGVFDSNGRFPIWISALNQWKEKPIFGIGYGNFYYSFEAENENSSQLIEYRNIHNGYLELLVACGLTGFVSIMGFGIFYIFKLLKCFLTNDSYYVEFGIIMIVIYACVYALINQLFILDRCLTTLLLVTFIGMARKMDIHNR